MVSAGRTVEGDQLVEFEQVVIREQDGQLAYEALRQGKRRQSSSRAVWATKK